MTGGFYFDDARNITEATALHWREFSAGNLAALWLETELPSRLVANFTFALNYLFWGDDPYYFRLVNVAIHLVAGFGLAWMISSVVRDLSPDTPTNTRHYLSALAALVFLLHPLNIQAVSYIVQRMTSLAAMFSILSFAVFVVSFRKQGWIRGLHVALSLVLALLAIGSKENAYLLPLLFALYVFARSRRSKYPGGGRSMIRTSLGVAVFLVLLVVAVMKGVSMGLTQYWLEPFPHRDFSGFERVLTQFRVHLRYLVLWLAPFPGWLNLDHDVQVSRSLLDPVTTLPAICAVIIGLGAGLYSLLRRPELGFPLCAYFLMHAIESMPISLELMFEHRMYLPMAFLLLFIVMLLARISAHRLRALTPVMAGVLLALASAAWSRNGDWSDALVFYGDAAAKSPSKFRPLYSYGTVLAESGELDRAWEVFTRARRLNPDHPYLNNQMGNIAWLRGDLDGAMRFYQRAVSVDQVNPEAIYNYATLLDQAGRYDAAIRYYRLFISFAPQEMAVYRARSLRRLSQLETD